VNSPANRRRVDSTSRPGRNGSFCRRICTNTPILHSTARPGDHTPLEWDGGFAARRFVEGVMICVFCSAHLDDRDQAVEAGWWPDFYAGDVCHEGPVCLACSQRFLVMAGHGEMELRPGVGLPSLAIPLQRHPNLGPPPAEFPQTLEYRGRVYRRTGKVGTRITDGVRTAEYEADDAGRVWLGADGRIDPE
jgi:hypothetical protein